MWGWGGRDVRPVILFESLMEMKKLFEIFHSTRWFPLPLSRYLSFFSPSLFLSVSLSSSIPPLSLFLPFSFLSFFYAFFTLSHLLCYRHSYFSPLFQPECPSRRRPGTSLFSVSDQRFNKLLLYNNNNCD